MVGLTKQVIPVKSYVIVDADSSCRIMGQVCNFRDTELYLLGSGNMYQLTDTGYHQHQILKVLNKTHDSYLADKVF